MIRSFQGYVERRADTVLGVGVSAISSTPRMFWQNHGELAAWQRDLSAAQLPIERGVVLDSDDRIRRALIERLMCDGEADLGALAERFGIDPLSYFATELDELSRHGELASLDVPARTIRTTAMGKLLVRNVCMMFDRYYRAGDRFSSTI